MFLDVLAINVVQMAMIQIINMVLMANGVWPQPGP
jgi:hypothetical protein